MTGSTQNQTLRSDSQHIVTFLVRAMFIDVWDMKLAEAYSAKKTLAAQIQDVEDQTDLCWIGSSMPQALPS